MNNGWPSITLVILCVVNTVYIIYLPPRLYKYIAADPGRFTKHPSMWGFSGGCEGRGQATQTTQYEP